LQLVHEQPAKQELSQQLNAPAATDFGQRANYLLFDGT